MIRLQKRSDRYHIDCQIGPVRLRCALGTQDKTVASRLKSRIELALAEGARSKNWIDLQRSLPATTYERFAKANGLSVAVDPTYGALLSIFWTDCEQRVKLGKMAQNTLTRYQYAVDCFDDYLAQNHQGGLTRLADITPTLVEDYQVKRLAQIQQKANSNGGNGLSVEVSVLHSLFQSAVDRQMISQNPVRKGFTPKETEVSPFTGEELAAMREACETDEERLMYSLFRHTGLRISDIADLKWKHFHFLDHEIVKRTLKRNKIVHIPLQDDLWSRLMGVKGDIPEQSIIIVKNKPASPAQIRSIVRLISQKANVENAHPHRFRHSMAVDLLMKGCSPYEVGQILGDTAATVEKHYLKFVPEMRQKLKGLLDDTSKGLEACQYVE